MRIPLLPFKNDPWTAAFMVYPTHVLKDVKLGFIPNLLDTIQQYEDFRNTNPNLSNIILVDNDNKEYELTFEYDGDFHPYDCSYGGTIHFDDMPIKPENLNKIILNIDNCITDRAVIEFYSPDSEGSKMYSHKLFLDCTEIHDDKEKENFKAENYMPISDYHSKKTQFQKEHKKEIKKAQKKVQKQIKEYQKTGHIEELGI